MPVTFFTLGAIGTTMNEIDVLKKIASNLTERKNSAAPRVYRVLCKRGWDQSLGILPSN
jgi:hypothetical protein